MVADANVSLHLHLPFPFRCSISFRQWSTLIHEKVEASWNRGLEGRPLSLLLLSHSLLFGTLILMHGATRMEPTNGAPAAGLRRPIDLPPRPIGARLSIQPRPFHWGVFYSLSSHEREREELRKKKEERRKKKEERRKKKEE